MIKGIILSIFIIIAGFGTGVLATYGLNYIDDEDDEDNEGKNIEI